MNTEATPTLSVYLRILWRRRWALVLPVLLATATAYALSTSQQPVYEAHADLLFGASGGGGDGSGQQVSVQTERRVATSPAVAARAVQRLGVNATVQRILGGVRAEQVDQLAILRIVARDSSPVRAAQVVTAVSAAYMDFRRDRANQATGAATAAHARQVQRLSQELQQLDRQLAAGLAAPGAAANPELQGLRARRDMLVGQLAVSQGRLDQLNLEASTQTVDISVIVPATASGVPVEPRPARTTAVGALLGLLVGFALVSVREQLNRGVRNIDELEQAVGASVRAVIPRVASWRRRREARLVMADEPLSPTAEAYRILQASLSFLEVGTKSKVLLVTSASPGEGKSTTAANLAIAFAEAGMKTALIDADLRHPRLHRFFKVGNNKAGLSELLTGKATFDEVVASGGWYERNTGLALLTAGRPLSQPTKLLGGTAIPELLAELRDRAVVVIDAPPTLPVADTAVLTAHADTILLVANPTISSRPTLEQLGRRLPSFRATILGIVVNAPEPDRLASPQYGYYASAANETGNRQGRRRLDRPRHARSLRERGGGR
jgi:capsular exopolysaccharide synthesis family protein